jgi:hypothetical protein
MYKQFFLLSGEVLTRCKENKECLYEVDREVFWVSHEKVGGKSLAGWWLPMYLCESAFFHNCLNKEN